jgi:hypothetical protein
LYRLGSWWCRRGGCGAEIKGVRSVMMVVGGILALGEGGDERGRRGGLVVELLDVGGGDI